MKFEVIYKFFLVWGLALSLLFVVVSGISMWLGFPFTQALDIHLFFVFSLLDWSYLVCCCIFIAARRNE